MQILILLPLLVHLWLLRKQRNRLLWEAAASLIVFSALLYTGDRRLYAAFLLLIFILDTGGEYILHIIVPVFILRPGRFRMPPLSGHCWSLCSYSMIS